MINGAGKHIYFIEMSIGRVRGEDIIPIPQAQI